MKILTYHGLDVSRVKKQYEKFIQQLERDDFFSAEVKKLTGTPYYRAKLDDTNRLLFQVVTYQQTPYALLLEVIHHHAYEKSRFLRGAKIDESQILGVQGAEPVASEKRTSLTYINPNQSTFHVLDKILSFDDVQEEIFHMNPPLILIGSAGSGKTALILEKMKTYSGDILYITGSPYLVQHTRHVYYAQQYSNDEQSIDFLSYSEFLETIHVPEGKEMHFDAFSRWLRGNPPTRVLRDANKLYEELKGVITGNQLERPFLSKENYLNLGIKQSIYSLDEREVVYAMFEKYRQFLTENPHQWYDTNLVSFDYLAKSTPRYDFIVVDEVQDFTPVQLALILKALRFPSQFILCGDSNQIVHPNFFSWAKIKSLFYQQKTMPTEIIRILYTNYRNAPAITLLGNKILKAKNARFGSVDKESHYLVKSQSTAEGEIYCLIENKAILEEINEKTRQSTRFAVIVLREDFKEKAKQRFQTPLIFSIHEAKGLEYENVILYGFLSSEEKAFRDIASGLTPQAIAGDLIYGRVKDKSDRSLEIYKFFINALYVGITRAVQHIYWIEHIPQHPLWDVLELKPQTACVAIPITASSRDEWQKEALRLEQQGKQEQADAIRQTFLPTKTVPWTVLTADEVHILEEKALNPIKKDKAARLLLFEYAVHYGQRQFIESLADIGFAAAMKPKPDYELLERKYFMGYRSTNLLPIMRQVELYGVDFKTVFNQTPLMLAAYYGNIPLTHALIEKGANRALRDNAGRDAFQIVLQKASADSRYAEHKLAFLYDLLSPDGLSLQVDQQLIKLDAKSMEFFLMNVIMAVVLQRTGKSLIFSAFQTDSFLHYFRFFPDSILSLRRKKRAYLSSILSKNEIGRQLPYNRKLFVRVERGHYLLNPELFIKVGEEWIALYTLLGIQEVKAEWEAERKVLSQ